MYREIYILYINTYKLYITRSIYLRLVCSALYYRRNLISIKVHINLLRFPFDSARLQDATVREKCSVVIRCRVLSFQ